MQILIGIDAGVLEVRTQGQDADHPASYRCGYKLAVSDASNEAYRATL